MTQTHSHGESHREADELAMPLSICSPYDVFWATYHASLDLGTRWSESSKIGKKTGYDSGSMLGYMCRNQPQGSNAFGVAVDKHYLNAIGQRGIRQRKINIGKAIQTASAKLCEAGKPVHVLNTASGHGRYVLDALAADTLPDFVHLRDYSPTNAEVGHKLTAERGLQDTVTFDEVDTCDRTSYQDFQPRSTLGIISDLHELFTDNSLISNSLYDFGDTTETGDYLIYTGRP